MSSTTVSSSTATPIPSIEHYAFLSSSSSPHLTNSISDIKNYIYIMLDFSNYLLWRELFLPVLKSNDVYGHVDGSVPSPPPFLIDDSGNKFLTLKHKTWLQVDYLVLSLIQATVSFDILHAIVKTKFYFFCP